MSLPLLVIVYDVSDDGRRAALFRLLKQYGTPVQRSVFEARLRRSERRRLLMQVESLIDPTCDRFVMYQIPSSHERLIHGLGERPEVRMPTYYII